MRTEEMMQEAFTRFMSENPDAIQHFEDFVQVVGNRVTIQFSDSEARDDGFISDDEVGMTPVGFLKLAAAFALTSAEMTGFPAPDLVEQILELTRQID